MISSKAASSGARSKIRLRLFELVDRVAVAEATFVLLFGRQARSTGTRCRSSGHRGGSAALQPLSAQGLCDPGQARGVGDRGEGVTVLGERYPRPWACRATYSWPLRMICAPNGGWLDILMMTWPQSGR